MTTKQDILNAIRQTAQENGGQPLGEKSFAKETGINAYDWKKFWARFGDAQKEAGFTPNTLTKGYTDEFIVGKMIGLIRKLGRFPMHGDLRIEKNNDPDFPSNSSLFSTKEEKRQLAQKISSWCEGKKDYQDIVEFCAPVLSEIMSTEKLNVDSKTVVGAVYLFKHDKHYKIGKTFDTVRRGNELKIQLPKNLDLIHEIKTDDPSGVEAYWHKRFESKRMNGEWFDLNSADLKAFKRWRKII